MTSPNTDPQTTPASDSSPTIEPFRLDFRVRGGGVMTRVDDGQADPVEIHEWMTWLRVRGDLGQAMLVLGRHNGDLESRPVGLFHVAMREDELRRLVELVESTKWAELPAPTGGDVTASQLEIDYARGSRLIRREFNAQSREFIAAIWPLMEALHSQCAAMLAAPRNALVVSVAAAPDPSDASVTSLQLTLTNPGTGPVAIVDPRAPGSVGPRAKLLVSPAGDDLRPPVWTPLPLPGLPEGQPDQLQIPAGGQLQIAVAWRAPQPGSYYLRGEWMDYVGVPQSPEHAPVMPLGADLGQALASVGPYVVRGAAFSSGAPFTAGKAG